VAISFGGRENGSNLRAEQRLQRKEIEIPDHSQHCVFGLCHPKEQQKTTYALLEQFASKID
jgi:hypothetical protein